MSSHKRAYSMLWPNKPCSETDHRKQAPTQLKADHLFINVEKVDFKIAIKSYIQVSSKIAYFLLTYHLVFHLSRKLFGKS